MTRRGNLRSDLFLERRCVKHLETRVLAQSFSRINQLAQHQTRTTCRVRLLLDGKFYNRDLVRYLLTFFHAANDNQAGGSDEQAAMIHCGSRCWNVAGRSGGCVRICFDRLPPFGRGIEGEGYWRWLSGTTVVADAAVVVGSVGASSEIDVAVFFLGESSAGGDAVAGCA